jgi:hypothetical protein
MPPRHCRWRWRSGGDVGGQFRFVRGQIAIILVVVVVVVVVTIVVIVAIVTVAALADGIPIHFV